MNMCVYIEIFYVYTNHAQGSHIARMDPIG